MSLKNKLPKEIFLKRLTQSHYDSHHFNYDTESRFKAFKKERYISEILSERKGKGRVFDIGCGEGVLSSYIKSIFKIKKLYAGDISLESLKEAKQKRIVVINLDTLALPFKSDVADVIISGGVIHHTPNPRQAFSELSRIAKKRGEVWLAIYNKNHPYFYLYRYFGGFFRIMRKYFIGKTLVNYTGPFLFYCSYYALQVVYRRNLKPMPYHQAINMFYDLFLTPVASFHTFKEIELWAKEDGFQIISKRTEVAGQILSFRLKKS